MNFGASFGLITGLGMVATGAIFANSLSLNSEMVWSMAIVAAMLIGMSALALMRRIPAKTLSYGIALPFLVFAAIGVNTVSLNALPILAMSQVSAAVERGHDGHFRAAAEINGAAPIEMLVDTGASVVLLRHEHAKTLGLDVDALNFDVPVITASGRSAVALIELTTVSIGGVSLNGIQAAVAMPGELHSSLLGMSYLGALEEVVLRGNEMVLRN